MSTPGDDRFHSLTVKKVPLVRVFSFPDTMTLTRWYSKAKPNPAMRRSA
ncbi:hypothetical protein [Yoonia sediminilitoris]|nr:hypothetical protein [Yoonia sediminilitoris]